ncbi:hypothetical protein DM860_001537 [Cuscuta australis]|uniref:Glycine-rich protein n=1 Tax=Cuscuta australis TaxID=267555 RepID=A0A328ECT2_9ASTE|nr:hypothetical protein DM860_001537 [Cuscuta australis]
MSSKLFILLGLCLAVSLLIAPPWPLFGCFSPHCFRGLGQGIGRDYATEADKRNEHIDGYGGGGGHYGGGGGHYGGGGGHYGGGGGHYGGGGGGGHCRHGYCGHGCCGYKGEAADIGAAAAAEP